jgi:hypothetical protein
VADLSPPSSIDSYKKRQGDSEQQSQEELLRRQKQGDSEQQSHTLFVPSYVKILYISNNVEIFLMEKDNSDDSRDSKNYEEILY